MTIHLTFSRSSARAGSGGDQLPMATRARREAITASATASTTSTISAGSASDIATVYNASGETAYLEFGAGPTATTADAPWVCPPGSIMAFSGLGPGIRLAVVLEGS